MDPTAAVRLALSANEPLGRRVAKLQAFHQHALQATASMAPGTCPFWLGPCVVQLLPLLLDAHPGLRSTACDSLPSLGVVVATTKPAQTPAAYKVTYPHQPPPGVFFDFTCGAIKGQMPPTGTVPAAPINLNRYQQESLLLALIRALMPFRFNQTSFSRSVTSQALSTCLFLLESQQTSPDLLPAVLDTMDCIITLDESFRQPSAVAALSTAATPGLPATRGGEETARAAVTSITPVAAVLEDVVDLLLGWCLDPVLAQASQLRIHGIFVRMKPLWAPHAAFASNIADSLVSDLDANTQKLMSTAPQKGHAKGHAKGGKHAQHDETAQHVNIAACVRLSGAFCALAQSVPPSAVAHFIKAFPTFLTALARLLAHTLRAKQSAQDRLNALDKQRVPAAANARRTHTDAKQEAETKLQTAVGNYSEIVMLICRVLQQLVPSMRGSIMDGSVRLRTTPSMLKALSTKPDTFVAGVFHAFNPSKPSHGHVVPAVRSLVHGVFKNIQQQRVAPDINPTAESMIAEAIVSRQQQQQAKSRYTSICLDGHGHVSKQFAVVWLAAGATELLLRCLTSAAVQPALLPGISSATAMLLCLVADADEDECMRLASDSRLFSSMLTVAADTSESLTTANMVTARSTSPADILEMKGVWALRHHIDPSVRQSASQLMADIIAATPTLGRRLLSIMLSELETIKADESAHAQHGVDQRGIAKQRESQPATGADASSAASHQGMAPLPKPAQKQAPKRAPVKLRFAFMGRMGADSDSEEHADSDDDDSYDTETSDDVAVEVAASSHAQHGPPLLSQQQLHDIHFVNMSTLEASLKRPCLDATQLVMVEGVMQSLIDHAAKSPTASSVSNVGNVTLESSKASDAANAAQTNRAADTTGAVDKHEVLTALLPRIISVWQLSCFSLLWQSGNTDSSSNSANKIHSLICKNVLSVKKAIQQFAGHDELLKFLCAWPERLLDSIKQHTTPATWFGVVCQPSVFHSVLGLLHEIASLPGSTFRHQALKALHTACSQLQQAAEFIHANNVMSEGDAKVGKQQHTGDDVQGLNHMQHAEFAAGLAQFSLQLLADADVGISQQALPLCMALSAGMMLPVAVTGREAMSQVYADRHDMLLNSLQPPSWHDSHAASAACNWRPAHLARLFALLFSEAAKGISTGGDASQQDPSSIAPSGLMLRRRIEAAPATTTSEGGDAVKSTAVQAIIGGSATTLSKLQQQQLELSGSQGAQTSGDPPAVTVLPSEWVDLANQLSPAADSTDAVPAPQTTDTSGPMTAANTQQQQKQQQQQTPKSNHHAASAAWQMVQDAAKSIILQRFKTHLGGPSQSLAALEKLVQGLYQHLVTQNSNKEGSITGQLHESAWLALEFVGALERSFLAACNGSGADGAAQGPHWSVLAFFAANRKVCDDWFTRLRPALTGMSMLLSDYHATLYHGGKRLSELHSQMKDAINRYNQQVAMQAAAKASQDKAPANSIQDNKSKISAAPGTTSAPASAGAGASVAARLHGSGNAPPSQAGSKGKQAPTMLSGKRGQEGQGDQDTTTTSRSGPALLTKHEAAAPSGLSVNTAAASAPGASQALPQVDLQQQLHAALNAIARDVADTTQLVAKAASALGEWEHLRGMHDWCVHTFKPLFIPFRDAARVPTGNASATPSVAGQPEWQHSHEDPLLWMIGVLHMAQGKHEQALEYLNTWQRQQSGREVSVTTLAALPLSGNSMQQQAPSAAAQAPQAGSGTAAPGKQQQQPGAPNSQNRPQSQPQQPLPAAVLHYPVSIPHLSRQNSTVATLIADCYTALSDWSQFHAFVTTQHKKSKHDARTSAWWQACLRSQHMQDVCALASFDVNGPFNPELQSFQTSPAHAAVQAGLQALTRQQQTKASAPGTSTAAKEETDPVQKQELAAHAFQDKLDTASTDLFESLRLACWQSIHPGLMPRLHHAYMLQILQAHLGLHAASRSPSDQALPAHVSAQVQAINLLQFVQPVHAVHVDVQASSVKALTRTSEITVPSVASFVDLFTANAAASGQPCVGIDVLTQQLRMQYIMDPDASTAATQHALLLTARAARDTANTSLFNRMCDSLRKVRSIAQNSFLSAAVTCAQAHVLGNTHAMSAREVLSQQMKALTPFFMQPKQLLALANQDHQQLSIKAVPFQPGQKVANAAQLQSKSSLTRASLVFGHDVSAVAARSLAAALLSFADWSGKPGVARAAGGGGGGVSSGPAAMVDWLSMLKTLAAQPLGSHSSHTSQSALSASTAVCWPHDTNGVRLQGPSRDTAAVAPAASGNVAAAAPAGRLIVPNILNRMHTLDTCAMLSALHLTPTASSAWLQWGNALLSWQREARHAQQQSKMVSASQLELSSSQTHAHQQKQNVSGPDEEQLGAAGMHALCMSMALAWSRRDVSRPEDTMPALLKILQIIVRYGSNMEAALQACLALPPAAAWQPLTPQLFAQLRHHQPAVRALLLSLLKGLAEAVPDVVLYPALAESQSVSRAGGKALPELQALLDGLNEARPSLLRDMRMVLEESERLTVTWEERWHTLLTELEVDVARRCVSLRAEIDRLGTAAAASNECASATQQVPGRRARKDAKKVRKATESKSQKSSKQAGGRSGTAGGTEEAPHVAFDGSFMVGSMTILAEESETASQQQQQQQQKQPVATPTNVKTKGQASSKQAPKNLPGNAANKAAPGNATASATPTNTRGGKKGKAGKAGAANLENSATPGNTPAPVLTAANFPSLGTFPAVPASNAHAADGSSSSGGKVVSAWANPLNLVNKARSTAPAVAPGKTPTQVQGATAAGWGASGLKDIMTDEAALQRSKSPQPPTTPGTPVLPHTALTYTTTTTIVDNPDGAVEDEGSECEDDELDEQEVAAARERAVEQRRALLVAKYTALMSPVVLALQRHYRSCAACVPETPAEHRFAEDILPQLAAAVEQFKSPDNSVIDQLGAQPQACWAPLKSVVTQLEQVLRKPSLSLPDVSPGLAGLRDSEVPIPGVHDLQATDSAGSTTVLLVAVSPVLHVLATKTRPKRLVLLGSDGHKHVFLLKGRDDLRMDERLMQAMRVSNSLLRTDPHVGAAGIAARNYSVTPLGERVGLIQWVHNTTSLFSMFKSWQQAMKERHAAMHTAKTEAAAAQAKAAAEAAQAQAQANANRDRKGGKQQQHSSKQAGTTPPQPAQPQAVAEPAAPPLHPMVATSRPSDLFFSTLLPELKAAGLPGMVPRQQWPEAVLKKVLARLSSQAPAQIVAWQLRGSSGSSRSWWSKQRCYSASLAVNSMLGYLMGIGDRHMDNILMDVRCGEILHIDFNVCFERGLKLRVPELVPFRLTQTLSSGLGSTGYEGSAFRTLCESILSCLQQRREVVVALLDAVLGDPLVGWSESSERELAARRDLELAVSLSLFVSRMEEIRGTITQQCQALSSMAEGPAKVLIAYLTTHASLAALQNTAAKALEQHQAAVAAGAALQAALAPAGEALSAAMARHKQLQGEARGLQESGQQLIEECRSWEAQHGHVLAAVRDELIQELGEPHSTWSISQSGCSMTLLLPCALEEGAVGLLQPSEGMLTSVLGTAALTAGHVHQDSLQRCAALDDQGIVLLSQWQRCMHDAVRAMTAYGAVLRVLLPGSYPHTSFHHGWSLALEGGLAAASPLEMEAAKSRIPTLPNTDICLRTWAALHAAREHAGQRLSVLAPLPIDEIYTQIINTVSSSDEDDSSVQGRSQYSEGAVLQARSDALDVLASFAAVDDDSKLQPLRSALSEVIQSKAQQLNGSLNAVRQLSLAQVDCVPSSTTQLGMKLDQIKSLFSDLNRTGLITRLTSNDSASTAHNAMHSANAVMVSVHGVVGLLAHASLDDLEALIAAGEVSLIRSTSSMLSSAIEQIRGLSQQASVLQQAWEEFQATKRSLEDQLQIHRDQSQQCYSRAARGDMQAGAEQLQIQQQIYELQQTLSSSPTVQMELIQQAALLHDAMQQIMAQVYAGIFGSGQHGTACAAADQSLWRTFSAYWGEGCSTSSSLIYSTWLSACTSDPTMLHQVMTSDAQQAGVHAARLISDHIRSAMQFDQNCITWGDLQPCTVMSMLMSAMLAASLLSAAMCPAGAESQGSTHAAEALPGVVSCWQHHFNTLATLHEFLEAAADSAQDVKEQVAAGAALQGDDQAHILHAKLQVSFTKLASPAVQSACDALCELATSLERPLPSQQTSKSAQVLTSQLRSSEANGEAGADLAYVYATRNSEQYSDSVSDIDDALPQLQAFTAFDPAAPGADMMLEGSGSELGGLEDSEETPIEGKNGSNVGDTIAAETDKIETQHSIPAQLDAEPAVLPSQAQVASTLQRYLLCVGDADHPHDGHHDDDVMEVQYRRELVAAVLQAVQQQQATRTHHMAAMAWMYEHVLMQAVPMQQLSKALQDFFAATPWNPLEPGARLHLDSRTQVVGHLQVLCDTITELSQQLSRWQQDSREAGLQAVEGTRGKQAPSVVVYNHGIVNDHLARRQQWLYHAQSWASSLSRSCAAVVQFEVSRQGAAWEPGKPLVLDAFATCSSLLTQLEVVYGSLGDQHGQVVACQRELRRLQEEVTVSAAQAQSSLAQRNAAQSQVASRLPSLVLQEAKIESSVESLHNTIVSVVPVVVKELGPLLQELQSLTSKQEGAAKDVAAMATSALDLQAALATLCDTMSLALLEMQQGKESVAIQHALPAAVAKELQAGRLPDDPTMAPRITAMGSSLLQELQPSVDQLLPCIKTLHELPVLLPKFSSSLDSLTSACTSVAAAIQSVHALGPEDETDDADDTHNEGHTSVSQDCQQPSVTNINKDSNGTECAQQDTLQGGSQAGTSPEAEGTQSHTQGVSSQSQVLPESTQAPQTQVTLSIVSGGGGGGGAVLTGSSPRACMASESGVETSASDQLQTQDLGHADSSVAVASGRVGRASVAASENKARKLQAKQRELTSAQVAGRAKARAAWMRHSTHAVGAAMTAAQQQQQEAKRKAYAVAALRRCIQKLEGKDTWDVNTLVQSGNATLTNATAPATAASTDTNPVGGQALKPPPQQQQQQVVLTVSQQVDRLIQQAISPDNLCKMFEGWMPWL